MAQVRYVWIVSSMALLAQQLEQLKRWHAHAGSRTRVTSMGGLYDAATLRALVHSNLDHYPSWTFSRSGVQQNKPTFFLY